MMPSETDELHEPLFQTVGTFLKACMYWRDFAKKRKKYSKSEYGRVSGVFQSPELREQKKK
jgi:hypothetical protein